MDIKGRGLAKPKLRYNQKSFDPSSQYAFFDLSGPWVTYFHPKLETTIRLSDDQNDLRVHMLNRAQTIWDQELNGSDSDGSLKLLHNSGVEESNTTGDASEEDSGGARDSGEEDGGDVFYEEGVKQKIEVLAGMVGIGGCDEPAVVLAEVVRVLKELDHTKKKH